MLVTAAAIAGYVALVLGYRRAAKILMVVALVSTARSAIDALHFGGWALLGLSLLRSLLVVVAVVALFAALHRSAPAVTHQRRWLGAVAPLAVLLLAVAKSDIHGRCGRRDHRRK